METIRWLLSYALGAVGDWLIGLAFRVSGMPDPVMTPEEVDRVDAVLQRYYRETHPPQEPRS